MHGFLALMFFAAAGLFIFISGAAWDVERRASILLGVAALAACLAARWLL